MPGKSLQQLFFGPQLLTEYGQQYYPSRGNQGLNRAAGRIAGGEIPMVAPQGADREAIMNQLRAQVDAARYFQGQPRVPGLLGVGGGAMELPSAIERRMAAEQAAQPSLLEQVLRQLNPQVRDQTQAQQGSMFDFSGPGPGESGWLDRRRDNGRRHGPTGSGGGGDYP